jgi:hypothetical protein
MAIRLARRRMRFTKRGHEEGPFLGNANKIVRH